MTDDRRHDDDETLDGLAALSVDAVDDHERLTIEALLLADAEADRITSILQSAATAYGESAASPADRPSSGLRARVLDAAFARRPPVPVTPAGALDTHLIETERFELLARRLTSAHWARPLDAPEFAGWTVRELVAHVTANEALLAQALGQPIDVPETHNANEARTAEVIDRQRSMTTDQVIDEYHEARLAADAAARRRTDAELADDILWWGTPMAVRSVLVLRAFETWTHADDIRRAMGAPQSPPPAPVIKQMSSSATEIVPLSISLTGKDYSGRSILIDLTGPGGGEYHVALAFEERDLTGVEPDAVVHIDTVAFCHGIGKRAWLYDRGLPHRAEGEVDLVDDLISTIDTFAVL